MRQPERKKKAGQSKKWFMKMCAIVTPAEWHANTTTYCETPKHVPFGRRREWRRRKKSKMRVSTKRRFLAAIGFWQIMAAVRKFFVVFISALQTSAVEASWASRSRKSIVLYTLVYSEIISSAFEDYCIGKL